MAERKKSGAFYGYTEIPGGSVDPGEDHRTAALRELKEETTLIISDHDLKFITGPIAARKPHTGEAYQTYWYYVIIPPGWIPTNPEPEARGDWKMVKWMDLDQQQMLPNTLEVADKLAAKMGWRKPLRPTDICAECGHARDRHFSAEMGSFCQDCSITSNTWEHVFQEKKTNV